MADKMVHGFGRVRLIALALLALASAASLSASRSRSPAADNRDHGVVMQADGRCALLPAANGVARGHERICAHAQAGSSAGVAKGDFDHNGFADLAIGVPGESVNGQADAGAVVVIYGSSDGLTSGGNAFAPQLWTQDTSGVLDVAEQGDQFGYALASGDFDGDGYSDLAIGVPGERLNGQPTGAVQVLYGGPYGLIAGGNQLLDPSSFRAQQPSPTERFGTGLAWGDFDGDGTGDLAGEMLTRTGTNSLGYPIYLETVGVLFGSATGIGTSRFQEVSNDQPFAWAGGGDLRNDLVISAGALNTDARTDLVIGEPFYIIDETASDGTRTHVAFAGRVRVFYPTTAGVFAAAPQIWRQDSPGIPDSPEDGDEFGGALAIGDFNGDARRDLAIGVRWEDSAAGAVTVIYSAGNALSATAGPGTQFFQQGANGLRGVAEQGDEFGSALAANDFNGDGRADLAIGAPGEHVGSASLAGAVSVIYGSSNGLSPTAGPGNQLWHQDSSGIAGTAEYYDQFGASLSAWNFGLGSAADLAIGVPGEELTDSSGGRAVSAGAVAVLYGSANGLTSANNQLWTEASPGVPGGPESHDRFGFTIY